MFALTTSIHKIVEVLCREIRKRNKTHKTWLFLKIQRMTTLKAPCFHLPHTLQTTNKLKERKFISVDTGKAVDKNSTLKGSPGKSVMLLWWKNRPAF